MDCGKDVIIYSLKDPDTNSIRYIGKTTQTIADRLKRHIYDAKNNLYDTHKDRWLRKLIKDEKRPIIEIVEVTSGCGWEAREIYWIKYYKENGYKLTNISIGGDSGNNGVKITEEQRRKISERMKGNKYSVGRKVHEEYVRSGVKRVSWNHGLKGIIKHSEERNKRMSEILKNTWKNLNRKRADGLPNIRNVLQFTKEGVFIKEFETVDEACKELGIKRTTMYENLAGRNKTTKGFIFKYKKNIA